MALSLPQSNGSRVRIPPVPNYRAVLEAYGFDLKFSDGRSFVMERNAPDNNGYEGAAEYRLAVPSAFEDEIQRQIEVLN